MFSHENCDRAVFSAHVDVALRQGPSLERGKDWWPHLAGRPVGRRHCFDDPRIQRRVIP